MGRWILAVRVHTLSTIIYIQRESLCRKLSLYPHESSLICNPSTHWPTWELCTGITKWKNCLSPENKTKHTAFWQLIMAEYWFFFLYIEIVNKTRQWRKELNNKSLDCVPQELSALRQLEFRIKANVFGNLQSESWPGLDPFTTTRSR